MKKVFYIVESTDGMCFFCCCCCNCWEYENGFLSVGETTYTTALAQIKWYTVTKSICPSRLLYHIERYILIKSEIQELDHLLDSDVIFVGFLTIYSLYFVRKRYIDCKLYNQIRSIHNFFFSSICRWTDSVLSMRNSNIMCNVHGI